MKNIICKIIVSPEFFTIYLITGLGLLKIITLYPIFFLICFHVIIFTIPILLTIQEKIL